MRETMSCDMECGGLPPLSRRGRAPGTMPSDLFCASRLYAPRHKDKHWACRRGHAPLQKAVASHRTPYWAIAFAMGMAMMAQAQVTGRYVRVDHLKEVQLVLAEVEVFSNGKNVALKGTASQSSLYKDGLPSCAIDGNRDGKWGNGSVAHTLYMKDPWWEVDLGSMNVVDKIVLWNQVAFGERLDNVRVQIFDEDRTVRWTGQIVKAERENVLVVKSEKPQTKPLAPPAAVTQTSMNNAEADKLDEQLATTLEVFKPLWESYKENADKIREEFQPKFGALRPPYLEGLEKLKATAQSRGDLNKAKTTATEIERFKATLSVPSAPAEDTIAEIKTLQTNYNKFFSALEKDMNTRLGALTSRYVQALDRLKLDLTKAGKLDEATAVSEARERRGSTK